VAIPSPSPGSAALITGASSGIGREVARQLSDRGHDVVLVARRADRLEALAAELRGRAEVIACDVSDPVGREAVRDRIAGLGLTIDVLCPCAGFGMGGEFVSQDPDRVQLMIRTNLEASVSLCRIYAPGMVERRRGAILIVSSMAGNQPMTLFGVYSATKAAVTSFGEMLHEELRPSGVSVTVLCPGSVSTEFASVADMTAAEKRVRGPFTATPEATARAGLEALEAGRRHVVPGAAVKVLHFAGGHAPRAVWLRACRKLMA
jgi:short-subunit dehydrogenase